MLKATLLATITLLSPMAAQANPYRYTEECWVMGKPSTCVVIDTRTKDGFLNTRNIFNNEYSYTMKQYWREGAGFVTWDSQSNRAYKYPYEAVADYTSRVSPHLIIKNVSWD
jgi:hypothetical protein